MHSYQALSPKELRFVAEAKLQSELSFFKRAGYLEVEETLQHWKWYLYCLTFNSHSFAENSLKGWSVVPRTPLKGAFVVRMPLDSVDLAIFAQLLDVQILLFQLFQPALRFGAGEALHLLTLMEACGHYFYPPSNGYKKNRTCVAVSLRSTASGALWHIWQGRALAFSAMMWRTTVI